MAKTKRAAAPKAQDDSAAAFERGMELLYKQKWAAAEKVFDTIVDSRAGSTVAERARRFVDVCAARSREDGDQEDTFLMAVAAKNSGDLDAAMEYCTRGGLKGRDDRFAYLAASIEVLRENHDEAARLLEKAIEMNPANRVHSYHDPDFSGLRDESSYSELFALS